MKLYIENNETIPAVQILQDSDLAPSGYTLIDTIDNYVNHGPALVGSTKNFMDWMCLRDKIKELIIAITGPDFANWSNLSDSEKKAAAIYIPTKIATHANVGMVEFSTASGGEDAATENIKNYLKKSKIAMYKRYEEMVTYAITRLGKDSGLKIEDELLESRLVYRVTKRRVFRKSDDGIAGLKDFFDGVEDFIGVGLIDSLNNSIYTLINDGSNQTNQEFIDRLMEIAEEGKY